MLKYYVIDSSSIKAYELTLVKLSANGPYSTEFFRCNQIGILLYLIERHCCKVIVAHYEVILN